MLGYRPCKTFSKNECSNLVKNQSNNIFKKMIVKVPHQVNLFGTQSNLSYAIKQALIGATNDTNLTVKGGNLVSIKATDEFRDEEILVELFNNYHLPLLKNH